MKAINENEKQSGSIPLTKIEINKHKKIAAKLKETAELHLEIANHLENNNYESAFQIAANAYVTLNQVRDNQHKLIYNMM
jgi:hypothetical protein